MPHKDILGTEIKRWSFIVFTSPSVGLRVGLVVGENADGWTGSYTYVHRKVKAAVLDHRDLTLAAKATTTPEIARVLVVTEDSIPEEQRDILFQRAKDLGYA